MFGRRMRQNLLEKRDGRVELSVMELAYLILTSNYTGTTATTSTRSFIVTFQKTNRNENNKVCVRALVLVLLAKTKGQD